MYKIFVDGKNGTTGLEIASRLEKRKDVKLYCLPEEKRKDLVERLNAIASSDLSILCLPDEAAKEIVSKAEKGAKIIDASTAHRVSPEFTYGMPELKGQREKIRRSKRVANPGCHASGFIALVAPLVQEGILAPSTRLSAYSLTGYTGGGKKMIEEYETDETGRLLAPRPYALRQEHKHLREMQAMTSLENAPVFLPVVSSYPRGMLLTVPLFAGDFKGSAKSIRELYEDYYQTGVIRYAPFEEAFMSASRLANTDKMEISVLGNEERVVLAACFDNLGKGASGAAVQNMNLMLGEEETFGLTL